MASSIEQEKDKQSDCEDLDEEEDYEYYYSHDGDYDLNEMPSSKKDPEASDFKCFTVNQVQKLLKESIDALCDAISVSPSIAKVNVCYLFFFFYSFGKFIHFLVTLILFSFFS